MGCSISGTYLILITRIVSAAALVGVMVYLVPRYHKQVAIVVASLVSAAAVGFLGFVSFQACDCGFWPRPGWLVQTHSGHAQHYPGCNIRCMDGI